MDLKLIMRSGHLMSQVMLLKTKGVPSSSGLVVWFYIDMTASLKHFR